MKKDIHPDYHPVIFWDSAAGEGFLSRSTASPRETMEWQDGKTYPVVRVDVSSLTHPFYTGKQRILDVGGRVEKFERRFGKRTSGQPAGRPGR